MMTISARVKSWLTALGVIEMVLMIQIGTAQAQSSFPIPPLPEGLASQIFQASPGSTCFGTACTPLPFNNLPNPTNSQDAAIGIIEQADAQAGIPEICRTHVAYPHNSVHAPGTVNAVGTIKCTVPVQNPIVDMQLYHNGLLMADTGSVYKRPGSLIKANVAHSCTVGTWQAVLSAVWEVQHYTPVQGGAYVESAAQRIRLCL